MAAYKAAADIEKERLKEVENEKQRKIAQMDLAEDSRAETGARTIRKFSNLERGCGQLSEEEFVGYNDVCESSSDESAGEASLKAAADDFEALKVRFYFSTCTKH